MIATYVSFRATLNFGCIKFQTKQTNRDNWAASVVKFSIAKPGSGFLNILDSFMKQTLTCTHPAENGEN